MGDLPFCPELKYLGVTLYRSLTYRLTPWVTSQKVCIARRTVRGPCWLWLGCWANNVGNSHLSPGLFNRSVLRSCPVPQCSQPPTERRPPTPGELWLDACVQHQRTIFLSSQTYDMLSFVAMKPHCAVQHAVPWSLEICSSQRSPVHRVGTHGILNRDAHLYPPRKNSSVHLITTTYVLRSGWITDRMRRGWRTIRDAVLPSLTSAPTLLEWPCQQQRVSGLTASAPVSDVSVPAYTNGVWPLLRPVSVTQTNRPLTIDHVILHCPIHPPYRV